MAAVANFPSTGVLSKFKTSSLVFGIGYLFHLSPCGPPLLISCLLYRLCRSVWLPDVIKFHTLVVYAITSIYYFPRCCYGEVSCIYPRLVIKIITRIVHETLW